jgi:putative salt-induced outer membrane protein YdiY
MPLKTRHLAPALAALILAATSARADQILLKNGDRLTGTVVDSDAKVLTLKTDYAGDIKIQWASITSITSAQNLHLALKDGQTIVGTVATKDDSLVVSTKSTGEITAPKADVTAIRNDAEEAIYEKEVLHPGLLDLWSGVLDTGLSLTTGDSKTLTYNFSGKAARVSQRDKISVYTTAVYARNNTTGVAQVTAHNIIGGVRGDLNVSDRFFAFGLGDFEYDQFQQLNLRSVFGGGGGYHLIRHKNTTLDVNAGGDYEREDFFTLTRSSGEALVGENFATKIGPRFTFSQDFTYYPNLTEGGQYRIVFDATAATKLKSWLSWQLTYSDRYISNPIPGTLGNNTIFTTGIRIAFGKAVF